jgi:acetyl CoA:N6-hydroxylysine acetyl transferase
MSEAASSVIGPGPFPIGAWSGMTVLYDARDFHVVKDGTTLMSSRLDEQKRQLTVKRFPDDAELAVAVISAATEAIFGWRPGLDRLVLDFAGQGSAPPELATCGLAVELEQHLTVLPELAMQRRYNWLVDAGRPPWPKSYVLSEGKRHPRRPPKPKGLVYARFIPWLSEVISFRAADLDQDVPLLHRWLNDPRVDVFWNEAGDIEKHRAYLSKILADPHMLPLIGCFGDVPFGYFEVYWAKENRIAPFYDADDYDRGWHVIVGEEAFRGRHYITAWLPSLMHYMFLDDCRTQRIVGEPAAAHAQQLRNLELAGFAKLKNFDFPHKRATLVMLLRERFFGDRLWLPAVDGPAGRS